MSILRIDIKNSKSIKDVSIELAQVNCLIGENGAGKTNVLKNMQYFYTNLVSNVPSEEFFDKRNPFNDTLQISITYDFSKLIKIANREYKKSFNINGFFKKIYSYSKNYLDENDQIKVTLTQVKKEGLSWNVPYEVRAFIKNMFPMYYVQGRNINLTDWEKIWETIGDIGKLKNKKDEKEDEVNNHLNQKYGEKHERNFNFIREEFTKSDIRVRKFNNSELYAHLFQFQLEGTKFNYQEKNLDYFSDGVNSKNYIQLLFGIVEKIGMVKMKEPLIIVDEPEIGLHPKHADELMEFIVERSKIVQTIVSTHSPRMVKNVISESGMLFHVSNKASYTNVKRMKPFTDRRESLIVSEKEASFYFSKKILFVEGATELRLFTNKILKKLFPVLNDAEVFPYDSDNVKLSTMHPQKRNTTIPYLLLLDLDKILRFKDRKFYFCGDEYNPLKNDEIKRKELFF